MKITFSWPENSPDAIPDYAEFAVTMLRQVLVSDDLTAVKSCIEKEVIPKLGPILKMYQQIKSVMYYLQSKEGQAR
jgi:hypothetical protein